ncbi:Diphthamide biosynthesis protein 2 [Tilletia horrida]|nr:Diphthamide biosynthesis protein 2 [Tilletia horrida]
MASAFSSSDTAILTAPVELDPLLQSATAAAQSADIRELYDVERTAASILQYGFRSIALQFPDEALIDSVPVYWALRDELSRLIQERKQNRQPEGDSTVGEGSSTGKNRDGEAAKEGQVPELYILADTSYGKTANLPALYVFPRLPMDPAHAVSSLAAYVYSNLNPTGSGPKTLILAYDVAYAHASEQVLHHLRASDDLKEAGYEMYAMDIDTGGSFKTKISRRKTNPAQCCQSQSQSGTCTTCGCQESCASQRPPSADTDSNNIEKDTEAASFVQGSSAEEDGAHAGMEKVALTSGRFVYLPKGQSLDPATSAVLYIGPESRALTNLLLHLGPAFPVVSYDPTRHDASSSSEDQAPPVRLETGKTNRLLMQRYGMVQRARDASVVGLLVGTLGVASYLPLLDRLRARLTGNVKHGAKKRGQSGGRKVYTVSVGKLNPAKLANFQEVEVWVLVACPENSLVGSKSGLGPSGAGASGSLSGANGHGGEFWRPIVTPYEMELALGPEGVWTGEYEVDLAKLADKLEKTKVADQGADTESALVSNDGDEAADNDEDEEDRPHYSFVTGTYVSRTRYGTSAGASHEEDEDEERAGGAKPSTVVAIRGGKEVAVIQSASRLTHIDGSGRVVEREWAGLTRPEGVERLVPSVLEVGRSGVAGGYSHAHGEAEGTS